jgi:hypothetical protein
MNAGSVLPPTRMSLYAKPSLSTGMLWSRRRSPVKSEPVKPDLRAPVLRCGNDFASLPQALIPWMPPHWYQMQSKRSSRRMKPEIRSNGPKPFGAMSRSVSIPTMFCHCETSKPSSALKSRAIVRIWFS